jgi:hypothetical protein
VPADEHDRGRDREASADQLRNGRDHRERPLALQQLVRHGDSQPHRRHGERRVRPLHGRELGKVVEQMLREHDRQPREPRRLEDARAAVQGGDEHREADQAEHPGHGHVAPLERA